MEMAEKIGVSQSTYHNWESCKSEIPLKCFPQISKVLGISLIEIIPDELEVLLSSKKEDKPSVNFSATEILKIIEENNVFLRQRVRELEIENQQLKRRSIKTFHD